MASNSQSADLPKSTARKKVGIDSLPGEILAEIFSTGDLKIRTDKYCEAQVFTNTQVCRRWRIVAISTPVLWSSLLIDLETLEMMHEDDAEHNQAFKAFAEMCLTRSGGHPLDIVISYLPSVQDFPWFLATSHRWKSLDIEDSVLHTMTTCSSFARLPALRSLRLRSVTNNSPDRGTDLTLPQLTSLDLPYGSGCLQRFNISIATLTNVKVQVLYSRDLILLAAHLSAIPNLTQLHLSTVRSYLENIMRNPLNLSDDTHLHLPKLQIFALESTPSGAWEILSHCHLPSLVHLCVHECIDRRNSQSTQSPDIAFRRFLDSFPRHLQSFRGQGMEFVRFNAVALQLKPRTIVFHRPFIRPDEGVTSLIQDIVAEAATVAHIERFTLLAVSVTRSFGKAFMESLAVIDIPDEDHNLSSRSSPPVRKSIDLYLQGGGVIPEPCRHRVPILFDRPSSSVRVSFHHVSRLPEWEIDDVV